MTTFSIITASYNSLPTIKQAWESLCGQSFIDWEWIVVDGASTDGTKEWLSSIKDQRVHWKSEKDKGIYDALNKGIERASGSIIGFLHSDDYFADQEILAQINQKLVATDSEGIYGDLKYISSESSRVIRYWKSQEFTKSLLRKGWMPPHPTCFIKKDVYTQLGLFDTSFKIAADYDFLLRCFSKEGYKFTYIPLVITHMRIGGASSKWQNLYKKSREDMHALRKNGMAFPLWILTRKMSSKLKQFI
jgi:glycosyltransferase